MRTERKKRYIFLSRRILTKSFVARLCFVRSVILCKNTKEINNIGFKSIPCIYMVLHQHDENYIDTIYSKFTYILPMFCKGKISRLNLLS